MCLVPIGLGIGVIVDPGRTPPPSAPQVRADQQQQAAVDARAQQVDAARENAHTTVRGDGYAVVMPGTPSHDEQTAGTGGAIERSATYMSARGGDLFEFDAVSIPVAAVGRAGDPLRETAAVILALAFGASETRYAGFPAWDELAPKTPAGGDTTFLRIVRAGTQTFEMSVQVDHPARTLPTVYRRFRASLRIT